MRWRGRTYIAPWMTGQAGRTVTVRYMPHHDHEIDICDANGRYLGPAHLADVATPEQLQALRTARAERARRLRAEVKAAETLRRQRFAPATMAGPAQRLGALTSAQAGDELAAAEHTDPSKLPDLIPPAAPPAGWRTPASLAALTTPGMPAPLPSGSDGASVQDGRDGRAAPPVTDEDGDAS
ncbi:Mu transposase C-terminal domain-containing protein [Streptomyces shenzhenensis]